MIPAILNYLPPSFPANSLPWLTTALLAGLVAYTSFKLVKQQRLLTSQEKIIHLHEKKICIKDEIIRELSESRQRLENLRKAFDFHKQGFEKILESQNRRIEIHENLELEQAMFIHSQERLLKTERENREILNQLHLEKQRWIEESDAVIQTQAEKLEVLMQLIEGMSHLCLYLYTELMRWKRIPRILIISNSHDVL